MIAEKTDMLPEVASWLAGRSLSESELAPLRGKMNAGELTRGQLVTSLILSNDGFRQWIDQAVDIHLYLIHNARLKMVRQLVPAADTIVDLGGANASLYDLGFPHRWKSLTVVDLPPDERHTLYRHVQLEQRETPQGPVSVLFSDMTNVPAIADGSVDLVFSGESIEHVTREAAERMLREVWRILKPGGVFCLDTPNRALTRIHTSSIGGGFINPDHKAEYYPDELQRMLRRAGFEIELARGICQMPSSVATQQFDYVDFVVGNPITDAVESAYLQFYRCRKPLHGVRRDQPRWLARLRRRLSGNARRHARSRSS